MSEIEDGEIVGCTNQGGADGGEAAQKEDEQEKERLRGGQRKPRSIETDKPIFGWSKQLEVGRRFKDTMLARIKLEGGSGGASGGCST